MEVVFRTKKLQRCYADCLFGKKTWGQDVHRKVVQRINLLQEAANMEEVRRLPGLDCHPLKGRKKGRYGITLIGRWRLEFSLQGESAVTIRIEEVSNHYGD